MNTSRRQDAELLRRICLYVPEGKGPPSLGPVKEYLKSIFDRVEVRTARSPFSKIQGSAAGQLARRFAESRIKDPTPTHQDHTPLHAEIDYEMRVLNGQVKPGGVPYDGRALLDLYARSMSRELDPHQASVVFTNRLITTFSQEDLRHHLRTMVCGFPTIISIPGIVEAPARPRDYHILRLELEARGASPLELERLRSEFKRRFIEHGDRSVTEVLKGLSLQAVMFHLTLDPFCSSRDCRLFNAHWQEDLMHSQLRGDRLCPRHARLVSRLRKRPAIAWLS